MTFYAASYYPRFSDPLGTFVALQPGLAELAAEKAAAWERSENWQAEICVRGPHDEPHPEGPCDVYACDWCDIVGGLEFTYRAKDLFTAAELKEHRQALRHGEVVCLSR